jgi:metallo-beta-lactamase family protein
MAKDTLGKRLVDKEKLVKIYGMEYELNAEVVVINALSGHADRDDLLAYVRAITPRPSTVFIVHGEEKQALSLGAAIQAEHPTIDVRIPHQGSTHDV